MLVQGVRCGDAVPLQGKRLGRTQGPSWGKKAARPSPTPPVGGPQEEGDWTRAGAAGL